MHPQHARTFLVRDRLDWTQPRLSWISKSLYRILFRR